MIRLRKARLSAGIVVGVAALVTPIAAMSGSASAAPTTAGTYHGTAIASNRVAQAGSISGLKAEVSSFSAHGPRALTHFAARGLSTVGAADAPSGGASTIGGPNGLLQNFNGLSDLDQAKVNGGVGFGEVTPPDQGMCIGRDPLLPGSPKVAFEAINSAVRETTPSGAPLRPDFSLATLFQDPFAQGDPRCLYDAAPVAVFTITSKHINPSAAYTVLGSNRIITVASGAGAHVSFAGPLFNQPRWGDYSFAQVDPSGAGVWLSTEYIPPARNQDPIDNWGTDMFQVNQFSFGF